jgi:hypothetical protein
VVAWLTRIGNTVRVWNVLFHPEVERWFLDTCRADPVAADLTAEAVDLVEEIGPTSGRPLVRRLLSGKFYMMSELDPGRSDSGDIRLLFNFAPTSHVVFLVAAAGLGDRWWLWYRSSRPLAEERYEEFLANSNSGAAIPDMVNWTDIKAAARTTGPEWENRVWSLRATAIQGGAGDR